MAQTIKLKRSGTQGAAPSTSNLELGEVAINTYDGKMYIKKSVNGTESIVEVGGSGTVSYLEAGMIEYEYTATSNQTTFSGSDSNSATLSYTANSIMVFLNGVLQDDGVDYTATNGTSVVFTSALTANDEVRIVAFTNVTTAASLQNPTKLDAITTVNAQAAYSLTVDSSAYTPSSENALIVSLNGITQEPGDSFTVSGSTITFSPALVTGDVVDYIVDMGRAVTIGQYDSDLVVTNGNVEVPDGEFVGDLRGATLFKGQAGEALSKGDVVYISGISGNTTVVSKADADDAAKMPAFGVVAAAANINTSVNIYTFGELSGLDTSSYSEGDELFVSTTAGALTNSAPTGESSKLQKIAKVTRSDNSAGSIFIMGAGRSNAVPNLDDGDIFIGNASNQAVSASLNTKIEDYLDAGTSTPTFSTLAAGNITTTGYIAGPSTFTIDPAAVGDNTGTLVVAGNLQVDGTTTTINSTTMTVDDLNITLASGAANAAAADGAGITVDGASAALTYNSTPDAWSFNKNLGVGTASPDATLEIRKDNASGLGAVLSLTNSNPSGRTGNSVAIGLSAYAHTTIDSASYRGAIIKAETTATGNGHSIIFETSDTSLVPAERVRIDHDGNVGIGTESPDSLLHLSAGSAPKIIIEDGANPRQNYIGIDGSDNLVLAADEDNLGASSTIQFRVDATERVRIDSSGRLLIGTSSSRETSGGGRQLQVEGTNGVTSSASITRNQNSTTGPSLTLGKTRDGSVGGNTAVIDGDDLGSIYFAGADGTDLNTIGASILSQADGTPSSNVMPANLIFSTNQGGSGVTEAMRISSNGQLKIGGTTNSPANVRAVLFGTGNASLIYNTGHTGLHINNENAAAGIDNYGAGVSFGRFASNSDDQSAAIVPVQTTSDEDHMGIAFLTHDTNTRANPLKEKMRITGAGSVGIGTTSPNYSLDTSKAIYSGLDTYTGTNYGDIPGWLYLNGDTGGYGIVGSVNSTHKFTLNGGTNTVALITYNNTGLYIQSDEARADFGVAQGNIVFKTGSSFTERLSIYSDGRIVAPGAHAIGTHNYYKQNWWFGGGTDLDWKKIADVTFDTGAYAAASFLVKYIDPGSNFGSSVNYQVQEYAVSCARSSNVQDNLNYATVRGPYNDRVRAFKTATGVYEIQVRQYANYRHIAVEIQAQSELKATITYAGGSLSNGSTSGTAYVPTGDNIQGFTESTTARGFFKVNDSSGNEKIRVDSDGLKFNGDTAAANALDDYEEGTWTPVLTGTTSGTKNLAGKYTKIGNKVTVRIGHWTAISSGTINGNVYITGLPFTPATNPWGNGAGIASYGLAHIRGQTSVGTSNAPWIMIDYRGYVLLHDAGNLGNTNAYAGQAATWSAGKLAQNNSTSVIIDWIFTYTTT